MTGKRVIVAGGSVGGLFAGVLLHRAGFDVTVLERSTQGLDGRGAGLVAQRDVFTILRDVGCEDVARVGVTAQERVFLDRAGQVIHVQRTPQMQISWDRLFRTFRELLPAPRYLAGNSVASVSQSADVALVRLEGGQTMEADLVIGADGLTSVVRQYVSAPPFAPRYAGYAAWRGLVPEGDVPPAAAAVLYDRFVFYDMPRSHALGYLVAGADGSVEPGRRRYNWVWYRPYSDEELGAVLTDAKNRRHAFSLPPGAVAEDAVLQLRRDADALLPSPFADAIRAEPRPFIQAIFDYATGQMVRGRVALLGDAAFVVRPHTAMGVSKAAGDALALREALLAGPDLPAALTRYEAQRMPVGQEIGAYGKRLGARLG